VSSESGVGGAFRERLSPTKRDRIRSFVGQILRNTKALFGLTIVLSLVAVAVAAPMLAPQDPNAVDVTQRTQGPSLEHPFGTDNFGRDVLSRVILGSRISVYVGVMVVGIATLIGVPMGAIGGYYGGYVDEFLMRLVDGMISFPAILLALVIVSMLGTSLTNVLIALGFVFIPSFARVTRGATLSNVNEEYVDAARARGESDIYIIFREILPNALAPVIVQATIAFAFSILAAAGLSFLGMGAQPPTPSWGLMISKGRGYLASAPWMTVFPGLAIAAVVLGFNMFGDGLRDILDPEVDTEEQR